MKKGKTNAKYLLIVIMAAVASGLLIWQYSQLVSEEFATIARLVV
ncbi:MAG: hypothetical protein AAB620_02350 [Patescibacteria group bacterium]